MMRSAEDEFERQLDIFHSECETAVCSFYAGHGLLTALFREPAATAGLGKAPIFWNATLDALKASTLITLGRVFDPDQNNYSLTRLLAFSQSNMQIFAEEALRRRLKESDERLKSVYEPSPDDFRRLKKLVASRRREYESLLRPWRHRLYAHRGVLNSTEFKEVQPDIEAAKMQKLVTFLPRVHGLLWRLYFSGQRPVMRPARYSVERMLEHPVNDHRLMSLQEKLVHEAKQVLGALNRDA